MTVPPDQPPDPFAAPAPGAPPVRPPSVVPGEPAGKGAGGLGTAALVVGVLAFLTGLTVLGGVLFGGPAVALGLRARARARAAGAPAGTAVAGIVLGLLGLLLALAAYLYVQDDLEEYQGCLKESISFAQDRVCEDALRRSLSGR